MARKLDQHLDEVRRIETLFGRLRMFVTGVGIGFGLLFTWLQLQRYSFISTVRLLDGQTLIHVSLIFYYYAWVFAHIIEGQMCRWVYIADPNRGKTPVALIMIIPILVAVGLLLFIVQDNPVHLTIVFTGFFIMDVVLFVNVRKLAPKYEAASAKIYEPEGAYARLAQLRYYVSHHVRGQWQFYRFGVMAFILALLNASVHIEVLHQFLGSEARNLVVDLSTEQSLILVPGLLFASYIVVAEGWMWSMRMRTRRALLTIDDMRTRYEFSPVKITSSGGGKRASAKSRLRPSKT